MNNKLRTPTLCLILCCLLLLPALPARAQERPSAPPEMAASRLTTAPDIDGDVRNDTAWSGAVPTTNFWQIKPNDGEAASQRTEVYVGYTDSALYIGVVAHDSSPDKIVVTDSRRDSALTNTDAFLIAIDGLLDRQNGFVFGTNAAGIEYDGQITQEGTGGDFNFGSGGFNLNWDGTWQVRSRIGDYGWSAEFEIPFRTLRYGGAKTQDWGINFQRNIRRNNEVAFWAPLERNRNLFRVSEAGTLRNIELPTQRNLKITPYALGSASRSDDIDGTETDTEFGVDAKYSVTASLTLDLTYNTDFAQVEVDEQQINLDRFNLFFPEKRPFFLENAGLFSVGTSRELELFFSRRIGISSGGDLIPVEGGARLSGKIGDNTNIGILHMATDAEIDVAPGNKFTVARISQELPNRSSIGAIFTNREGDGSFDVARSDDYNRAYAVDGRWGIGDNLSFEGWFARTDTPGRTERDDAFSLKGNYSSATWEAELGYSEVGEDFNPEMGFLARQEYRKVRAFLLKRVRNSSWERLLEIRPHLTYIGYWKFDSFQESGFLHLDIPLEFRSGSELQVAVNFTHEGVIEEFEIIKDVEIPVGTYKHDELNVSYNTDQSKPLSFGVRATAGGRFGGHRVSIAPSVAYRIGETFRTALSINYNDFDLPVENGEFTANLASLDISYSFTPKMQLQALLQYNDNADKLGTNIRFSWLRSANSGLFLVYNDVDYGSGSPLPGGREAILKYSYIFDVFD